MLSVAFRGNRLDRGNFVAQSLLRPCTVDNVHVFCFLRCAEFISAIIEGAFEDIKREAKEEEVDPFVLAIRGGGTKAEKFSCVS